jgi:aryl-alcohol dehydrogenase-like predicted oxidoreductase
LKEVAAKYGKTPGQTGLRWRVLRWLLDQEGITAVSVGVSKPEQQRLADVSWPLSEGLELWDTL